ncbi:Aldo-ket-red domain-containing protein [Mycena indigotica]|uniref:Aldo-ket-red domain-containing protein n=1 Tax=Mycena indigotica TaxID=2126181 RepID=A0A8H6S2J8_9AGAR|nr:Aldo-ket-red domain-containing protein [Mycena indigotica]KAF7290682.1 Aldo-ket-red domain-containing protein [Mycena indigotica]
MTSNPTATYTRLGNSGLRVSVPIVGCMSFGLSQQRKWVLDEEPAIEVLKAAWDNGLSTYDTANMYSNGESERILGKFIKKHSIPRSKILIFTKVHHLVVEHDPMLYGFQHPELRETRDYVNQDGLSRAAIFNAVEASLERLDTPYIDLLQIHRFDPRVPVEETMRALHDLVQSGKVRYIGASSMKTWRFQEMNNIAEKNGWTKFVSMQNEFSLLQREEEREMIPYCKAKGIGLIPYSTFAAGNLSRPLGHSSTRSESAKGTIFEAKFTPADEMIIGRVEELAKKKGCTMSQIAFAWALRTVDSPIVGLSSVQRVEEIASRPVELTDEESKYLTEPYAPKADPPIIVARTMSEPKVDTESMASQVFGIPELLLLILSFLAQDGKGTISSVDTSSLSCLARVSRNISQAALDVLWRTMYRPDAIVNLLPDDAYHIAEVNGEYELTRPLTEDDFMVFDKYASRVHYVEFSNSSAKLRRGCELFPYIKDFRYPLFPLLKEFRWEVSVYNGSIGAFYLICPDTPVPSQELTLLMWSEIEHTSGQSLVMKETIDSFNNPALPWLPDVERMNLRTLEFLPGIRNAIRRLTKLQHISFDLRADPQLFERLSTLPYLKSLDTRHLPHNSVSLLSPNTASFALLESIRVSGEVEALSSCLLRIASPNLHTVRLVPHRDDSFVPTSLFQSLVPSSVPQRTTSMTRFTFTSPHGRDKVALKLVIASLSPLYACRNLEVFRVDVDPGELVVTEYDVHAMATAWPRLVDILIAPPRLSAQQGHQLPLYCLWDFAVWCPRIEHLAIEVNADVFVAFVPPNDGRLPSIDRPQMTDLVLFCAPCGDPDVVASFIKLAFPNVSARAFQAYGTIHRPEDVTRWAQVTAELPTGDKTSFVVP